MSPSPPAAPDPGRPRLVRVRGRSGWWSIRGRNGSQSSRGAGDRFPPTVLAVTAVALLPPVALALRLAPAADGVALTPASGRLAATPTPTAPASPDVDPDQAALLIAEVLDDERSWRGSGTGRFALVPSGSAADLHAYLATPGTTDQLCAPLLTRGRVSCQNGSRVVLNAERWVHGAVAYGDDTTGYRRYLVNHEFGHALGRGHVGCPGRGRPAPVMMQQTKGLGGCRATCWPARTGG